MINKLELVYVKFIPETLEPGKLYVSEEYEAALHLCACGCGSLTSTPLSMGWVITKDANGPTINHSIGNWKFACRSHYFVRDGKIVWA
jgi:hypothetical protein